MQTLKPIIEKSRYYKPIQEVIMDFLLKHFYEPLYNIIEPIEEFYNSATANQVVEQALRSGQIQYVNGKFSGRFSVKISKALREMGAKFNKVTKTYDLAKTALPLTVQDAVAYALAISAMRYRLLNQALEMLTIEKAMPELQELLDTPLEILLEDLGYQAELSLKKAITIVPELSPEVKKALKEQYFEDVKTSIINFTEKQRQKLKEMVKENLFEGLPDNKILVQEIVKEFQVTENKAVFLARQESSLLVAKYRQIIYKELGIKRYKWQTAGLEDERVRPMHRELEGKIFYFDSPPITNKQGDRNNPGEDWLCRCVPIPIIDEEILG